MIAAFFGRYRSYRKGIVATLALIGISGALETASLVVTAPLAQPGVRCNATINRQFRSGSSCRWHRRDWRRSSFLW